MMTSQKATDWMSRLKKGEIKWEVRNYSGYIFRPQKQFEENFLAFAPTVDLCAARARPRGGGYYWRRPGVKQPHHPTLTYLVLLWISIWPLMQTHSTMPECSMLLQSTTESRADVHPICNVWMLCTVLCTHNHTVVMIGLLSCSVSSV